MNNSVFLVFLVGYFLIVAGVAYGMHAAGISAEWITTMVLIAGGLGVIGALTRTRTIGNHPSNATISSTTVSSTPAPSTHVNSTTAKRPY